MVNRRDLIMVPKRRSLPCRERNDNSMYKIDRIQRVQQRAEHAVFLVSCGHHFLVLFRVESEVKPDTKYQAFDRGQQRR